LEDRGEHFGVVDALLAVILRIFAFAEKKFGVGI
jgi:hypothetical protein